MVSGSIHPTTPNEAPDVRPQNGTTLHCYPHAYSLESPASTSQLFPLPFAFWPHSGPLTFRPRAVVGVVFFGFFRLAFLFFFHLLPLTTSNPLHCIRQKRWVECPSQKRGAFSLTLSFTTRPHQIFFHPQLGELFLRSERRKTLHLLTSRPEPVQPAPHSGRPLSPGRKALFPPYQRPSTSNYRWR